MIARALAAVLLLAAGAAAAEPLTVRADSYPVAYFAERLAGDAADVVLPVPPDRDPAVWVPPIGEIAAYQEADLIILNGAGLAAWTSRTSLPRSRTLDTSAGFANALISAEGVTHSHGPDGEHSHAGVAAFTWLDLQLAARQGEAVAEALSARLPDEAARIAESRAGLVADLESLDAEAQAVGRLAAKRPLLASHPRYQYLARRYGLDLESVTWQPDAPPDPGALAELDALLAAHPATIMLWEAEPGAAAREALGERGIASVVFTTLANRPAEGDFVAAMHGNLGRLRDALSEEQGTSPPSR